jgi:glycosyltransferase involved in cell wall biosynthesis
LYVINIDGLLKPYGEQKMPPKSIPTLGLCIITFDQDAPNLKKCLSSFQGELIDKIFITDTSKNPSDEIKSICETYSANYSYKRFRDDFSEVRNYNFRQSTTDYILWVDSDDYIQPENYQRLLFLQNRLDEFDVWIMEYVYASTPDGKPALLLPRERIVKSCPEIKWNGQVHEALSLHGMKCTRVPIFIHHEKAHPKSDRNLRILTPLYESGKISQRLKFYYGKELFDTGQIDTGAAVFEDYLQTFRGRDFPDNGAIAAQRLCSYHASKNDLDRALLYALKSIAISPNYAEAHVYAADVYARKGNINQAIKYYKIALTKTIGSTGMTQLSDFYGYIPAKCLTDIYMQKGEHGPARKYCSIALRHKPDDPYCNNIRDQVGSDIPAFCWLFPGIPDETNGSQRIRRINIHKLLTSKDIKSIIIQHYSQLGISDFLNLTHEYNIFVFQSYSQFDYDLMSLIQARGGKCVFDDCERLSGYPWLTETMSRADVVTCCSTELAEYRHRAGCSPVAVLPDAWEGSEGDPDYDRSRERPVALYIGMGGNSWLASSWLRPTIEDAGYELRICSEWDDADIKWGLTTWRQTMFDADIIVCPQRVGIQPAKSNVKITQAMSMGLPVIASPLRAYLEIIKHGENGYIANTLEDWSDALRELRDSETRARIGKIARQSVLKYGVEQVAALWVQVGHDALVSESIVEQPSESIVETGQVDPGNEEDDETIDLIIPTYGNWEYLRLTLDSILMNTLQPYRIIISDAGSDVEFWERLNRLQGFQILGAPGVRKNFSEAVNAGIEASTSRYFVVMNSDLVVSRGWLRNVIRKMNTIPRLASCGVLSNCDRGWRV